MGLLGLPVPGPSDVVRATTGVYTALDQAVSLVPRIAALVGRLEVLAARADRVIDEVDAIQVAAAGVIARTTLVIGAVEEVVGVAGGTVERVGHVVTTAEGTVKRVDDVVTVAAGTVDRVDGVVASASGTVARVDDVVDGAQVVVGRTSGVVDDAAGIVRRTAGVVDGADGLLDSGGALVQRIAETTSEEELQAIVHLIDTLPQAVDALRNDVLPVMSTLGTVAPDVRDLLDIASQLNGVLGSVPGLGRIKKRVQRAQADEDNDGYRADEEPPSSPQRG